MCVCVWLCMDQVRFRSTSAPNSTCLPTRVQHHTQIERHFSHDSHLVILHTMNTLPWQKLGTFPRAISIHMISGPHKIARALHVFTTDCRKLDVTVMGSSTKAYQYQALWKSVSRSRSWNKAKHKRGTHASTRLHPALLLRRCLLTPLANLHFFFTLSHIQFDALSLAVLYYANPLFIMRLFFYLRFAHACPLSNNATRPQKKGRVYIHTRMHARTHTQC